MPVKVINVILIGDLGIGKTSYARRAFGPKGERIIYGRESFYMYNYVDTEGTEGRRCSMLPELLHDIDLVFLCRDGTPAGAASAEAWYQRLVQEQDVRQA